MTVEDIFRTNVFVLSFSVLLVRSRVLYPRGLIEYNSPLPRLNRWMPWPNIDRRPHPRSDFVFRPYTRFAENRVPVTQNRRPVFQPNNYALRQTLVVANTANILAQGLRTRRVYSNNIRDYTNIKIGHDDRHEEPKLVPNSVLNGKSRHEGKGVRVFINTHKYPESVKAKTSRVAKTSSVNVRTGDGLHISHTVRTGAVDSAGSKPQTVSTSVSRRPKYRIHINLHPTRAKRRHIQISFGNVRTNKNKLSERKGANELQSNINQEVQVNDIKLNSVPRKVSSTIEDGKKGLILTNVTRGNHFNELSMAGPLEQHSKDNVLASQPQASLKETQIVSSAVGESQKVNVVQKQFLLSTKVPYDPQASLKESQMVSSKVGQSQKVDVVQKQVYVSTNLSNDPSVKASQDVDVTYIKNTAQNEDGPGHKQTHEKQLKKLLHEVNKVASERFMTTFLPPTTTEEFEADET